MSEITGVGPLAITGKISASAGQRVGTLMPDGSMLYRYRETRTFTDITLDGNSVKEYGVIEARIGQSSWGYVMTTINPFTGESMTFPDGSKATYVTFGTITIS